jgi:lactoylglutathione lyase
MIVGKIIDSIAHVAYNVKDMQKSLDFYCGFLGFTHAFSLTNDKGEPWIEYIKAGPDQFIELFYSPADREFTPSKSTNNHICLDVEDILEVEKALTEANLEIVIPLKGREGANWQIWSKDPDGNFIEFMYVHPDSQQARA